MAQGVSERRVGAHRVAAEDERSLAHLALDHVLQVVDQLWVSITLSRRSARVGLAVAAGVVGDHRVAVALQRAASRARP